MAKLGLFGFWDTGVRCKIQDMRGRACSNVPKFFAFFYGKKSPCYKIFLAGVYLDFSFQQPACSFQKDDFLDLQTHVFISKSIENAARKNLLVEDKQGTPLTMQGKYQRQLYFFIQGLKIQHFGFGGQRNNNFSRLNAKTSWIKPVFFLSSIVCFCSGEKLLMCRTADA